MLDLEVCEDAGPADVLQAHHVNLSKAIFSFIGKPLVWGYSVNEHTNFSGIVVFCVFRMTISVEPLDANSQHRKLTLLFNFL